MPGQLDPLPFTPVGMDDEAEKLSMKTYEEIRDKATQIELNKLMNSKSFAKWNREKENRDRMKLEHLLGGLGLLIALTCLITPFLWVRLYVIPARQGCR